MTKRSFSVFYLLLTALAILGTGFSVAGTAQEREKPRLIFQITADALRGELLTISPAGDELTFNFAKALIRNKGLGSDGTPDHLSVIFSSTGYVGHIFGPSSLEGEDNIPQRSGDIYLVFDPNRLINDFDGLTVATAHGSPWRYDTYVPIMFAGMGISTWQIGRRVETIDIAPTLSLLAGAKPASGATGSPLLEVLHP